MTRTPTRRGTRGKSRYTLSPEERAERLSAARQQLLDGVDKLMTADGWQQLITSRAWLRRDSLHNVIMILQQCPDATDVRPLSEWKALGYGGMRKGTRMIKIWKPQFRPVEPEQTDGRNGTDETTAKTELSGFLLVPVVDVSQLQRNSPVSRPAPPLPIELSGDAPTGLWDAIAAQITARGYRIERGDCGGAFGRTIWAARRVIVRADVEPAQAAKTLTHELAHILRDHQTRTVPRPLREVEAESVACIVAAVCGLDTLAYSPALRGRLGADRDTARQSAERVLCVADTILDRLDHSTRTPSTTAAHAHPAAVA